MLSHRQQLLVVLLLIVGVFAFFAKLDWILGQRNGGSWNLYFITIGAGWFWMWVVGYPLFGLVFAAIYLAGADETAESLLYAIGIFLTVILLAVGQLEDEFWFLVNRLPYPSGDWACEGWTSKNNLWWRLAGTWNTQLHFIVLFSFIIIVVVMWIVIFKAADSLE
jgi:hypothetical protein